MKTVDCPNLTKEIESLLKDGYRLDMIIPADDPRNAILSKDGESVRLVLSPGFSRQKPPEGGTQNWIAGRAGMEYRDLIPDRLSGRVIASHIRITKGGDVPDYVHYHKIKFQMIYCKSGSIRVVYEDQGPPFVLETGDCVLQPPEIRHRVLESSKGAEVIEVSSPAEHETWVEHEIELPTGEVKSDRDFGGQKFVHHSAATAAWFAESDGVAIRDTGIKAASNGTAHAYVIRIEKGFSYSFDGKAVFLFVLSGTVAASESVELYPDQSMVVSEGTAPSLVAITDAELLTVTLPEF